MNIFRIMIFLCCLLLAACGASPIKLKLVNMEIAEVKYANKLDENWFYECNQQSAIKLSFVSDISLPELVKSGNVQFRGYLNDQQAEIDYGFLVYKNIQNVDTRLYTSENLSGKMRNIHAFDVYAFCKLRAEVNNIDGHNRDVLRVNLLEDNYQKVSFRLVVAQVMLGVRYKSNLITLTKEQISQLNKIKEESVIFDPITSLQLAR